MGEPDWDALMAVRDALMAVRERAETWLAAERAGRQWLDGLANRVAAAVASDGLHVCGRKGHNGPWPPRFTVTVGDDELNVHVMRPGGLDGLVRDEIHDCRTRLAGDLLRCLRDAGWDDADETAISRAITGWLAMQGVSPGSQ